MPMEDFHNLSFVPLPLMGDGDKYVDSKIYMGKRLMNEIVHLVSQLLMEKKWTRKGKT